MKDLYILILLTLISCSQKAKEKKAPFVNIQDAVEHTADLPKKDKNFSFKKNINELKTKTVPLIDSTNFDTFIEEIKVYNKEEIGILQLKKIYPNYYKEGYNYRAIPNYKMELSKNFHSIVITIFKGDNEMESVLINYDLEGNMIDSKVISYDEIAEGQSSIQSKIEYNQLTVNNIFWVDEKQQTTEMFKIDVRGKIIPFTLTNTNDINSTTGLKQETEFRDTIAIDYRKHETLLTVLKLLPETTMESWEWSKKDRVKTVAFIEKNNYLIDSTEMYHNIKYMKPNTMAIQAVDGVWTLSIYEFNDNHSFIVTNDIVGDGNDIQTFNFINNVVTPLKTTNWFDGFESNLLLNTTENCIKLLEENQLGFNYNFRDTNNIEISAGILIKSETEHCLKGNTIKYRLNKQSKTFDIVDVYWKNDTDLDVLNIIEYSKATVSTQELMPLTKKEAINKYGRPSFSEQFILDDAQGEFRNRISDKFTQYKRENKSIVIDELTWEKDKNTWITVWYQVQQENSVPKSVYVWKKGTEF